MITVSKLPTLCAITILALSLLYLSMFRPSIFPSQLDSSQLWTTIASPLRNYTEGRHHDSNHHHHSDAAGAPPSKPPIHHSSLSLDAAGSGCSNLKPNLILSALDGPVLQDQIFIFLQSLDIALGEEYLATQRARACPPAPVYVHILVPPAFLEQINPGFRALMERYPSLELIPILPEISGVSVVLARFKGWAEHLKAKAAQYDKVLISDLDVVFQKSPFTMPMDSGVELLYFTEWRGLKIGQCGVHRSWFSGCVNSQAITQDQYDSYKFLDRICAGNVFGTTAATQVYLDLMTESLKSSRWGCNDQAMHIHLYYSSLLREALKKSDIGKVYLVPNEEALLGTVGTTPLVRFNEWGEFLNDAGQVQHVVHQFKQHPRLSEIVWRRYGWFRAVGDKDAIPPPPEVVEEGKEYVDMASKIEGDHTDHANHPHTHGLPPPGAEVEKQELKRYILVNVTEESCNGDGLLCSCRNHDCQLHYEWF